MADMERARGVADYSILDARHKVLTLRDVKKFRESLGHSPKVSDEHWNDGARVLAFEDGSVYFASGNGFLWRRFEDPHHVAQWTDFLDKIEAQWSRPAKAA
jgi:hypothetical protein